MKLGNSGQPTSMSSEGDLCLDKASSLKYLDLNYCKAHVLTFEEILASCHSLEKFSMAKTFITSKMIRSICYQNGQTLQTLNLNCCSGLDLESIQNITKNCAGLNNVDLIATRLSKDSINFLVNNLTPKVEKLSIGYLQNLKDDHVITLVNRCNKLSVLNLEHTRISYDSLTYIIKNLHHTLEKLYVRYCYGITVLLRQTITKLKSMPKLRVLNYGRIGIFSTHEQENLKKSLVGFGESICVDERELLLADGIWDVEAKQIEYFKKFGECQFKELPDEIITSVL